MLVLGCFALLIVVLAVIIIHEFKENDKIRKLPSAPKIENDGNRFDAVMSSNIHKVVENLENNVQLDEIDFSNIEDTCYFIDQRFDCYDFRMQSMIRILYKHGDKLPQKYFDMIKKSLLGAKFFMDQNGQDSVCYWSENHQFIFAVCEYLLGQMFEQEIFTNDGLDGKAHKAIAEERINIWLEQRFLFGFTEWYSNTYYEEDIGPLSNLIDFCNDEGIANRTKMIMDLLLFDMATQSYKGSFTSTSGRAYEEGKKSGKKTSVRNISKKIWGFEMPEKKTGLDVNFLYMDKYTVPEVIREIGKDTGTVIIKASNGLDLKELALEMPKRQSLDRTMMQWSMEAFSNPEIITDTMKYIHKNHMLSNEFLNDFKLINLSVLKSFHLLPLVSKLLRPVTNGVAIQRANTYTYKTSNYMLSTAQKYHVGEFGDQHHIWSATVSDDISIFSTHPAAPLSENGALSFSPNYWVGNGRNPHSAQDENINLTIYNIDGKKGFLEKSLLLYSHMYFPIAKFDEVKIEDNFAFAKKGETLIAVVGKNPFEVKEEELIQKGAITYWLTELCSEEESFSAFIQRIKNNAIVFDERNLSLQYCSNGKTLKLVYNKGFSVNEKLINTQYKRFESKYSETIRKAKSITIQLGQNSLFLDFDNGLRKVNS